MRQGCAISSTLFDIFIDDLDEAWERKNEGGTVVGKEKVFAVKYADNVGMMAESAEGLRNMLKSLESWVKKKDMEINIGKTKIMTRRNGGKIFGNEKWWFKDEGMKIVNEFKYLGYWFTAKNSEAKHAEKTAGKAQTAANAAWGEGKRTGRKNLSDRMYLMDILVKSGMLYGVEIWGWGKIDTFERIQGKYTKMMMGIARNTPKYIWRNESGVISIEYTIREREREQKDMCEENNQDERSQMAENMPKRRN